MPPESGMVEFRDMLGLLGHKSRPKNMSGLENVDRFYSPNEHRHFLPSRGIPVYRYTFLVTHTDLSRQAKAHTFWSWASACRPKMQFTESLRELLLTFRYAFETCYYDFHIILHYIIFHVFPRRVSHANSHI